MELFSRLYAELDATTRTGVKVAALERYFREAPPEDAAWALYFLTGRRIKRAINTGELHDAVVEVTGLPDWLIGESYDAVGDMSETISLVLPPARRSEKVSLHRAVEDVIVPMRRMSEPARRAALLDIWDRLPAEQRFIFHKLISGSFRIGVSRTLTVRALAAVAGIAQAEMEHRVMGDWEPTPEAFAAIMSGEVGAADSVARPYPFFLASQLDDPVATLGPREEWQVEWKWDGIRAQLIRRSGKTLIWSRGEELVTDRFPEVARAADSLPDGTVLDGEILAWDAAAVEGAGEGGRPLPFAALQTRIGRTRHRTQGEWLFVETPVVFMAYDVLEHGGADVRPRPVRERRSLLEALVVNAPAQLKVSPLVTARTWEELAALRLESRARNVEGLMLKRLTSVYGAGRTRGDWWKWKIDPYTVDTVMIAAQPGHGRRASVYTDYTFGVWSGPEAGQGELVPVAKAYSGLTDEEIDRVDAFVRRHATGKFGPVRTVEPRLVFELAFEAIAASGRHKSGIALRFPRISRWREDKKAAEADTLGFLQRLLRAHSELRG